MFLFQNRHHRFLHVQELSCHAVIGNLLYPPFFCRHLWGGRVSWTHWLPLRHAVFTWNLQGVFQSSLIWSAHRSLSSNRRGFLMMPTRPTKTEKRHILLYPIPLYPVAAYSITLESNAVWIPEPLHQETSKCLPRAIRFWIRRHARGIAVLSAWKNIACIHTLPGRTQKTTTVIAPPRWIDIPTWA